MPIQYLSARHTATVFSQTSQAVNYPASRLVSTIRPFRAWRSTSTAAQTLIFDLGASVAVAGVCLYAANFTTADWSHAATSGGAYTAFSGNTYTISEDPVDRYRKQWIAESFTHRYIKLVIPNQTPTDGAAYFSLGSVFFLATIQTVPAQSGPTVPMSMTLVQPRYEAGPESRLDVMRTGHRYVVQDWTARMKESNFAAWQLLTDYDLSNPTLFYFNRGNTAEVYYLGYVDDWSFELKQVPTIITARFRQVT